MMTTGTRGKTARRRAWLVALFVIACLATYYVTMAIAEASQMLSTSNVR